MMADNRGMRERFSSLRAHGAKFISLALLLALVFSLAPVSASTSALGLHPSVALAEETQTQTTSLQERLAAIEGVTSVTPIEQTPLEDGTLPFKEKYLITITQPISWDDPSLGTFEQRVEVGYQGDTNVTEYETGGYMLYDVLYPDYLESDDRDELCKAYNANLISFEYRFFGESTPAGLSYSSTDLWEYLTAENAAADFHAIIGKISQVLSGKRIFTGASKGGFTTNVQAYLYPDDADAFVSYVAPLCDGTQDPRACKNIYETIGDNGMSQEQAKEYRDLILQFQVECITNRTALVQKNREYSATKGYTFSEDDNIIFDMQVNDFAAEEWQLYLDFDGISAILQMEDGDEKVQAIWDILNSTSDLSTYSQQDPFFPYFVQAATQMGENALDFSYLRTALNAAYEEAKAKDPSTSEDLYKLVVTPDMDGNLLWDTVFTAEQQAAFQYDDTLRNELIYWSQTTTAHVVMIYGGIDVWYPTRIPDVDNPSIYRYVAPAMNHRVRISDLTESEQTELWAALNTWLTDSTENVLPDTSDDALPFSAAVLLLSGVGACCVLMRQRGRVILSHR